MATRGMVAALRRLVSREPRTRRHAGAKREIPRPMKPAPKTRDRALEQLTAEARYHRERYELYTARMYGLRASSPTRLRELRRAAEGADARLAAAKATREHDA